MDNDSVNVRNLEQIQEQEGERRGSRLATVLMASLGGAALVIAGVTTLKRSEPPAESKADPLAALVAKAKREAAEPPEQVADERLDFPDLLSDEGPSTTALAAVKDERGRLIEQRPPPAGHAGDEVPVAPDKLPVVPLPAGTLLNATPVTKNPKDGLTKLAAETSRVPEPEQPIAPGTEGGYQLQVASFRDQGDADGFVEELRKRGHRAYRQAAYVPGRGLWHRVRIGPFKSKFSARNYQQEYEAKERMSTFLVDPDKVERQRQIRAHKLAVRRKKYGAP